MPRSSISPKKFVEAWQTSDSLAEVAKKTGMSERTCSSRASVYRKKGIPLKDMPRKQRSRIDWEALAAYARTFEEVS